MDVNSTTFERIEDKKRRNKYLANQIKLGLSFQLRALRKDRNLTQKDLADLLGTQQTVISRIENHNASKLSIPTILKMAEVFDVGVVVRFEPIDIIADWFDNLSPSKLSPQKSEDIVKELIEQSALKHQATKDQSNVKSISHLFKPKRQRVKRPPVNPQQQSLFSAMNLGLLQGSKSNLSYLEDFRPKVKPEIPKYYQTVGLQNNSQKKVA